LFNALLMVFTHKLIAEGNLIGMGIGAVGGLFLAYDLLGGKHGPLRTIARATGYALFFFVGYASVIGFQYACVGSVGLGLILAVEFSYAAKNANPSAAPRYRVVVFGFARGIVLGLAAMTVAGVAFGATFGLLSGTVLAGQYLLGFAPSNDYRAHIKPRISAHNLLASLLRAVSVAIAGTLSGLLASSGDHWLSLGLRLGLGAGIVSALVGIVSPAVEWRVDHIPERRLGVFGLLLVFVGLLFQSVESVLALLDVAVR
jgi:hypothetical protein